MTKLYEYKGLKNFYRSQMFFTKRIIIPFFKYIDSGFKLSYCKKVEENISEMEVLMQNC